MSPTEMETLARTFFDAVERGDIETVGATYAPDAVIWHNTDGQAQTPAENLATLTGFVGRIPERRYAERRVNVFPGGFVQQHVLKGVRKDGERVELPCCIVCQVKDGKISRLDEYFDSVHVAAFRKVVA
jgi:ketosteroid isomerase-like protein